MVTPKRFARGINLSRVTRVNIFYNYYVAGKEGRRKMQVVDFKSMKSGNLARGIRRLQNK